MASFALFDVDILTVLIDYLHEPNPKTEMETRFSIQSIEKLLKIGNKIFNVKLHKVLSNKRNLRLDIHDKKIPHCLLKYIDIVSASTSFDVTYNNAFWAGLFTNLPNAYRLELHDACRINNCLDRLALLPKLSSLRIDISFSWSHLESNVILSNLKIMSMHITKYPCFDFAPNLEKLTIKAKCVKSKQPLILNGMQKLKSFYFMSNSCFEYVIPCVKLETLCLDGVAKIPVECFACLSKIKTLIYASTAELDIAYNNLFFKNLERNGQNIQTLKLWFKTNGSYYDPIIRSATYSNLTSITLVNAIIDISKIVDLHLVALNLCMVLIEKPAMISQISTLKTLSIMGCCAATKQLSKKDYIVVLPAKVTEIIYSYPCSKQSILIILQDLFNVRTIHCEYKLDHSLLKFMSKFVEKFANKIQTRRLIIHEDSPMDRIKVEKYTDIIKEHIPITFTRETYKSWMFFDGYDAMT
jgi:hypothetical protein